MKIEADSVEEFVDLAKALGMVPAVAVNDMAQEMAKQMLAKAGFTITVDGAAAASAAVPAAISPNTTMDTGAADASTLDAKQQEVILPAKTTKVKKEKAEPLKSDEPKAGEDILGNKVETGDVKALTKDDAVAAMRKLAAAKNIEVCRELLKKYDAPKASQVPDDKIAAFVAEASQMAEAA